MENLQNNLAQMIISRRKELKINQDALSDLSQVAIRTIRDMEKGVGNPSLLSIYRVMNVLGIELLFNLRK